MNVHVRAHTCLTATFLPDKPQLATFLLVAEGRLMQTFNKNMDLNSRPDDTSLSHASNCLDKFSQVVSCVVFCHC